MEQWGFYFDQDRCINCHTCVVACKVWNHHKRGDAKQYPIEDILNNNSDTQREPENYYMKENLRRVLHIEKGNNINNLKFYNLSISCNHCDDPACVRACKFGHLIKEDKYGIVKCNENTKCVGCRACLRACLWDSPQFYPEKGKAEIVKCDLCLERISQGLKPACVAACVMRALDAGPIEELRKRYPDAVESVVGFNKGECGPNIIFNRKKIKDE